MLRLRFPMLLGLALVAALTVALAATGFGHRMPSDQQLAMDAYTLAGGKLADLCGGTDGSGTMAHQECPACHIAGAMVMPETAAAVRAADLVFVAEIVAPRESRALRHLAYPARTSRAPPLA